jgi:hypothetical protein
LALGAAIAAPDEAIASLDCAYVLHATTTATTPPSAFRKSTDFMISPVYFGYDRI